MIRLLNPSNELIEEYLDLFSKNERYYSADEAISNLFKKFPENKKLEDILLKISVINDLYSTNIFGTFIMAKHIQKLQIDNALENVDLNIVNQIAIGHGITKPKSKGDRNFYSFATKYCNWHKRDEYPIYDSFVHKTLIAYRDKDVFSTFEENELKNFKRFKEIIGDFKTFYLLTSYNLQEIDKFLWIYGQKIFPNKFKNKKEDKNGA